nr:unnamed protein product [Spirometra erinaceieuropaei]
MDDEVVLNISAQTQGDPGKTRKRGRKSIEAKSSHEDGHARVLQPNRDGPVDLDTSVNQRNFNDSKPSKLSQGAKNRSLNSHTKIPNSERTLKFAQAPDKTSKNPLQVGLSAKQHPSQEEFLNTVK